MHSIGFGLFLDLLQLGQFNFVLFAKVLHVEAGAIPCAVEQQ
jgi:hypothetical protein